MRRFRDRSGGESGGSYSGSHSEECAYAQSICSDGRSRPVKEAEMEGTSTSISRPQPYPTGTRSEPGQHY
jgi:hypothetical protein